MKILGGLTYLISWLWLLVVTLQPFGKFIRLLVRPRPIWLNWFFKLPGPPPPMGPYTLANSWPMALGVAGTLVAFVILSVAKRREKKGRRYEC
jgi:hypothetical protein